MPSIYDVIRHLVRTGAYPTDTERQAHLDAIDAYENPPAAGAPDPDPAAQPEQTPPQDPTTSPAQGTGPQ